MSNFHSQLRTQQYDTTLKSSSSVTSSTVSQVKCTTETIRKSLLWHTVSLWHTDSQSASLVATQCHSQSTGWAREAEFEDKCTLAIWSAHKQTAAFL